MRTLWSTPWTVVVIAVAILVIVLARGGLGTPQGQRAGLAIIGLLVIGFLWPPLGIVLGGIALFYLVFVHGAELLNQLSSGLSAGGNTQ
jgi:hypothetical protein